MKILNALQMRQLDAYTIEHEPITSADLMERASRQVAQEIESRWPQDTPVVVFAGSGNNGGDALCVARMLIEKEYAVEVYLFNTKSDLSTDCALNRQRLQTLLEGNDHSHFFEIQQEFTPPELTSGTLVVDGLFGTGLTRPLSGGFAAVVQYINASPATVVSIDMPSGLMTEDNAGNNLQSVIHADYTFTFQCPKLAFFFPENESAVGEWVVLDIGLEAPLHLPSTRGEPETPSAFDTPYHLTAHDDIVPMLHQRDRFAYKGMLGHACLIAGQADMAGAAVLAAKACLRSGVGKLTVRTEEVNRVILQVSVPEAILSVEPDEAIRFSTPFFTDAYDALGVGPGIGVHTETVSALADLLYGMEGKPLVLDADALNILAEHPSLITQLPENTILTPHRGEMLRLLGETSLTSSYELLQASIRLATTHRVYIVLKGAYTAVISPEGKVRLNPTGNPGMATAGSGDVLTGIILSLLAQGYESGQAALLGAYLHGLAGDIAADRLGQTSLIASDIVDALPSAFMNIEREV